MEALYSSATNINFIRDEVVEFEDTLLDVNGLDRTAYSTLNPSYSGQAIKAIDPALYENVRQAYLDRTSFFKTLFGVIAGVISAAPIVGEFVSGALTAVGDFAQVG
jgi:hypothetical protein